MTKMRAETQTWEVTLLTPLHIGDGEEMQKELDYFQKGKSLWVMDPDAVIKELDDRQVSVTEIERFNLSRFEKEYELSLDPLYRLAFTENRPPLSFRRFIKDAHGRPYLPASSLKGGIRTALWPVLSRPAIRPQANYKNFKETIGKVSGSDPNHDFLRPFQLSDSPGVSAEKHLALQEIKFFNIQNQDRPGWKSFEKGNPTKNDFNEANGLYVEALKSGASLYLRAGLDGLLRNESIQQLLKLPECSDLKGFPALARAINAHSQRIARAERDFFDRFAQATGVARDACDGILQNIEIARENAGDEFILRLAWGSGWRGMTGHWIEDPSDMDTIRREENLGKILCPTCRNEIRGGMKSGAYYCKRCNNNKSVRPDKLILSNDFPKTRRLGMKGGIPCLPLGWIHVRPVPDGHFFKAATPPKRAESTPVSSKKEAQPETPEPSGPTSAKPEEPTAPSKPPEPETEIWETVHLSWTPNNGMITAQYQGKKATTTEKGLVPESLAKKLFGKKKKNIADNVEVKVLGNAYEIVKIY